MATTLFDRPLFVQRKRYIEEIATLEDAFDLLEAWPADARGLAHEVVMDACQQAHAGKFPLGAFRANLERFLRRANLLTDVQDVPDVSSGPVSVRSAGPRSYYHPGAKGAGFRRAQRHEGQSLDLSGDDCGSPPRRFT